MIITGDVSLMVKVADELRKIFKVRIKYNIRDFLRCEILELPGETHAYQTRIIEKFLKKGDFLEGKEYITPSSHGYHVVRSQGQEGDMNEN
jgi:hypothetical protein